MTFTDKYEILQSLTRGRVEIFVARDRTTDEQVLAHIFGCPEQKPQQPTVQWVLESFNAIAPEPSDLVIDTGQYAGTSYAYLITKLPSEDRLRTWVQSYEAGLSGEQSAQFPASFNQTTAVSKQAMTAAGQPVLGSSDKDHGVAAASEMPRVKLPPQAIVKKDMTSAEDIAGSTADPSAQPSATSIAYRSDNEEPGEFTKRFFPELGANPKASGLTTASESGVLPSSSNSTDLEVGARQSMGSDSGSITSILEPMLASSRRNAVENERLNSTLPSTVPPKNASEEGPNVSEGTTGEFTRFLRGPFNGGRAAETPDLRTPYSPREKTVGEFTQYFGKDGSASTSSPSSVSASSASGGDAGSITEVLAQPASGPQKTPFLEGKPPAELGQSGVVRRFSTGQDVGTPHSLENERPIGTDRSSRGLTGDSGPVLHEKNFPASEPEGATRLFSTPGQGGTEIQSKLPEGPSEYTRVISGDARRVAAPKEPAAQEQQHPESARANASAPVPAIPANPSPRLGLQVPPSSGYSSVSSSNAAHIVEGGCYHAPTPAEFSIPVAPQPPQAGSTTPKAAGVPWAMILILNGLFVLAVLLVLYFALKH